MKIIFKSDSGQRIIDDNVNYVLVCDNYDHPIALMIGDHQNDGPERIIYRHCGELDFYDYLSRLKLNFQKIKVNNYDYNDIVN